MKVNRKKTSALFVLIAFFIFLAMGCGEDERSSSSSNSATNGTQNGTENTCGDPQRSGSTDCSYTMGGSCSAGQYCDADRLTCSIGCLSDNNCASNQFCDLDNGVPGVCRTCTSQSTNGSQNNQTTTNQTTDNQTTDNQTTNSQTTNNQTTTNQTDNQSQGGQATCEQFCDTLINLCSDLTPSDRDYCIGQCGNYATMAERECVVASQTCADADNCLEGDMVDDFGDVCTFNNECQGNMCVYESSFDSTGYCSAPCNDWTDCPAFWDCESVSGASGKFCVMD